MVDSASLETRQKVLAMIPQQPPFRFIDELLELSDTHATGKYTFKKEEFFYQGHFPGHPITPGVILIETMAQTGVVALGLYKAMKAIDESSEVLNNMVTLFTNAEVEFAKPVYPENTVIINCSLVYFRMNAIKAEVEIRLANGDLVANGTLSGMGVKIDG